MYILIYAFLILIMYFLAGISKIQNFSSNVKGFQNMFLLFKGVKSYIFIFTYYMGAFTIFDILTDNPGIIKVKHNKNLYEWNNKVRVILKDGSVSDIGYYNGEGSVYIGKEKKHLSDFFSKRKEYWVADSDTINYNYEYDGFLMNNYVYNKLLMNKNYKKCTKDKNLYELLLSYIPKKKKSLSTNLLGMQQIYIPENDDNNSDSKFIIKNIWTLTNPNLSTIHGKKNEKRIETIIENFLNFSCKFKINTDKSKKIIQIKLIYEDEESNKFWNIEYTADEYKVNYGKKNTKGKTQDKKSNIKDTEKLIESKLKKGYKQISKGLIKYFTIK